MNEWTGPDLNGLDDIAAIIQLEQEFPGWMCFRGTNWLCYARKHDDPETIVRGEDWTDLRDMIRREIGRSE